MKATNNIKSMKTIHLENRPEWVLNLFFTVYFFLKRHEQSTTDRSGYCDDFTESDITTTSWTRHTFSESCEMYSLTEIHIFGVNFSYLSI